MAVPAIGAHGELLVKAGASATGPTGYDFTTGAKRYEILSESFQAVTPTVERDGFRGSRSLPKQHLKLGARAVAGQITLAPGPADLADWLPRIMRKPVAGDTITYGLGDVTTDAVIKFGLMIDRVTDVFTYDNCQVARASFRGAPGQLLTMTLDIIGFDEDTEQTNSGDGWPVTPPDWGQTLAYQPYIYHEGVLALTAVATANDPMEFELSIDHMLQPRFVMSQVATELSPSDQVIALMLTMPFDDDHRDMYRQSEVSGITPAGGTLTFTNGSDAGLSTIFTFAHLQGGDASPTLNTKGELSWAVPLRARASGGMTGGVLDRDELVITNDATPT